MLLASTLGPRILTGRGSGGTQNVRVWGRQCAKRARAVTAKRLPPAAVCGEAGAEAEAFAAPSEKTEKEKEKEKGAQAPNQLQTILAAITAAMGQDGLATHRDAHAGLALARHSPGRSGAQ